MSDYSDHVLTDVPRRSRSLRWRAAGYVLLPLFAILFQVYFPRFLSYLSYLELPLLVTVYFSLTRRNQVVGILTGAAIGLAQDSLSHQPVGLFGIVKTLVGYFAASVSGRFEVGHPLVQFILILFFFVFHQFFFWVLSRALLGQQLEFRVTETLVLGLLNGAVAVALFAFLDRMKERA
jgi:rod shape-determining protein MreD